MFVHVNGGEAKGTNVPLELHRLRSVPWDQQDGHGRRPPPPVEVAAGQLASERERVCRAAAAVCLRSSWKEHLGFTRASLLFSESGVLFLQPELASKEVPKLCVSYETV